MSRALVVPISLLVLMSVACGERVDRPDRDEDYREGYDQMAEIYAPVERVDIAVTDCASDSLGLVVRPWAARVEPRAEGYRFQWRVDGADSFSIIPKDTSAAGWPFTEPSPRQARPPAPVTMTVPPGLNPGTVHHYRILLRCGDRVYDIDPEIWIR